MNKNVTRGLASLALATALAAGTSSCVKDLDHDPPLNSITTDQIFRDPAIYKSILAKLYAGLNITGQSATGQADISADDEGQTAYSRLVWKLQELTTDEAVVAWSDGAIQDLNHNTWTSTNNFIQFMYARIYLEVGLCNEYLRETTDAKLSSRSITGADADKARAYRAEARFLRALAYLQGVDFFGGVPITTESDPVGYFYPEQKSRTEVFNYVESELKAIENELPDPNDASKFEYGRASKGAAQALLARMYLNAEVYTGSPKYTECVTYCNKVMAWPNYALASNYRNLFRADNNVTSASEIIFAITQDGLRSRTYGGTTFLVHAAVSGTPRTTQLKGPDQGIGTGWGGIRARKPLPLLFGDSASVIANTIADQRSFFSTTRVTLGQNTITDIGDFNKGITVRKWSNLTSGGAAGSDPGGTFVDTDIPFLRLGDVYLMYAEAIARGGAGGDAATALQRINDLRQRAYKDANGVMQNYPGDIATYDLDFLFAERSREMYWEGTRRTDLIRFGKYTGGAYNWPFKGSNATINRNGMAIPDHLKLFPIPASELTANPKVRQNPGY
ncbi:MAG: RagB/SusD family nutrient uptake outer membrane protein [Hymenobacteraceae bacterium]|nr:RagB/SusD family nutrient uptake outer membrane protein [Hymenobacteraceae bacterium]